MAARTDPFYIIRAEATESLNELQAKMSRFHGLAATNPERKEIAKTVDTECNSIIWQLNELNSAVDVAAENPARFNLTIEECNSRRRWIENTRRQVHGIKDSIKTATAAGPNGPPPENRFIAANDNFLKQEQAQQQRIIENQDKALDEIGARIVVVGQMGRTIGEELNAQGRLLDGFEQDVDTTHSRLRATQRRMQDLIRKSGSNVQLGIIVFLIIVLVILAVFAFM